MPQLDSRTERVRRAARWLTTPLLPDDYLHLLNPLWSSRELRGRIVRVEPETEHASTLVIKPGWGWSFDYRAGQYIGIAARVDGRWHWRSYSLTSTPTHDRDHIAITVKAMPEGFLSGHLTGLEVGTVVRLAAPAGDFVLPDPPPPSILFLTAGSGITPVMSMLRTLERRGQLTGGPDVVLLHSAPTEADVLFRTELQALAALREGLTYRERITDRDGMLDLARLADVVPDWAERQTWACGPPAMLDAAEQAWQRRGIDDQLHLERFSIELAGAGGVGGTVTFELSGRTAENDGARPLLETGEQAGVLMPFGCRMGICQSCVVGLKRGKVRDLRSGVEHQEGDRIQTCISAAAGDCVLDI